MTQTTGAARGVDWAVAVTWTVFQAMASLVVAVMSLFFVMVGDTCGTAEDEAFLCSTGGTLVFLGGIGVEWLLLLAGVIISVVLLVRAGRNGTAAWKAPLIGTGVGLLGIVVLVVTLVVVTTL